MTRLVGEAATNALRHNGVGTRLRIRLDEDDDHFTVSMLNDLRRAPP